jgi:glycosyltransferase involved in cell wall biosynthesis
VYIPVIPAREPIEERKREARPAGRDHDGLRILFIVGPMVVGGAERQAMLLAHLLRERYGAYVEFWAIYGEQDRLVERLDRKGLPWRIVRGPVVGARGPLRFQLRQLARFVHLTRELRRADFDVVMPYMALPSTVVSLVWRLTSIRACVWNQRSNGVDVAELNIARTARWAALNASACVANSTVGAEYLRDELGVDARRVHYVRNGVQLQPAQRSREEWRAALGIDEDCIVATMIANLHPPKDHPMLLRAWAQAQRELARSGRRAVLLLAGRATSTFDELLELSRSLGIAKTVAFIGAVTDVTGLLDATDFAVFASRREGTPNGVLESMAAGLPVVATDIGGIGEAMGETAEEMLVDVGDVDAMARRIVALAGDAAMRDRIGAINRARIEREFSPERMAASYMAIMEGILGR